MGATQVFAFSYRVRQQYTAPNYQPRQLPQDLRRKRSKVSDMIFERN